MKNIMKKTVAFLCVLTLSVGAMAAWTPAKEVKATEASTDPTPVYLEGYKHVTLENFNIPNEVTYSEENKYVQLKDNNGAAVTGNFDKTLLSLNVDFTYDSDDRAALMFGGSGWNTGFAFSPNNSGSAVGIFNYDQTNIPMTDAQVYNPGVLQASSVKAALGRTDFSFLEPFTLQVSFEYTTEGAETYLTLVFYINGKQIEIDDRMGGTSGNYQKSLKMKVTNSMTNHGNYIGYRKGNGGTLKLSSPKITLPNKAFLKSDQVAYKLQDSDTVSQLGNTSFEGKVTFLSNSDNDMIYYGGDEAGYGLRFTASGDNGEQLKMSLGNDELSLDANTAKVNSFVNEEFNLKITTEYADYDGDNDSNDIQLGIYINGELYNNRYLYAYDITDAGNYVTIYSDESDESDSKGIMVRSVSDVTDVTYDLAGGAYTAEAIATAFGTVAKVRLGETVVAIGEGLTLAGDYTLYSDEELVGELVLYKAGDVHLDNVTDVRDLVAMKKVNANIDSITWAATMGAYKADFSETTICNIILGIETQ